MMILALEFSSPQRSVALLRSSTAGAPPQTLASVSDQGDRSVKPIPLIEQLLEKAAFGRELVDTIVVGLGPGSYTGIRSAIALAQGWQLARSVRTCGVSSVETLARQAQVNGWFGQVSIVIDAQRQELYLATYAISAQERKLIRPLHLVSVASLSSQTPPPNALIVGPEATRWFPNARILDPAAETLGQLAQPEVQSVPAEELQPIYLRAPGFIKTPRGR
jgi:tRNA threonylcarbamoyl adenosine modification protein YeaZ